MYGTSLLTDHYYKVAYYDSDDANRTTETTLSDGSGNVPSQHTFVADVDLPGTWHVILCDAAQDPPSEYDASWAYTIAEDTFTVQQSAIPEFPTILAAIASLALCAGIYLLMRRKLTPARAASRR